MRALINRALIFVIMNLQTFLQIHIFGSYDKESFYRSCDYMYHFRDQIIDHKYVTYTLVKNVGIMRTFISEKCTIGKYLRKAYNKLTPAQITHLCEKYKSVLLEGSGKFNVIEGDAIKDAYYRINYVPNHGTLSNSCMRYMKCQKYNYFQIYADHAKMLIMTPKRGKRILGRAILWKYNDIYLMDRVYSAESYIEYQFYAYARKMGWGVLKRNSYVTDSYTQQWLLSTDNYTQPVSINLQIKLDKDYDYFPFVDSVCYLNKDKTVLSTVAPANDTFYVLHKTNGGAIKIL